MSVVENYLAQKYITDQLQVDFKGADEQCNERLKTYLNATGIKYG